MKANRISIPLIIICLLHGLITTAQEGELISEKQFDFIPPSPNAAALGKYGSNPIDLSSGAVNVNIPIYTFKTGSISVPISLSHRTTAIKVDQTESWTGLNWELNAGGVVTRTIFDQADEESLESKGYLTPYPENFDITEYETQKFVHKDIEDDRFDTQVDEYSYNFMGYSGKFICDKKGRAIVLPKSKLKIEKDIDHVVGMGRIEITTPDGMIFFFGGDYVEITRMENAGGFGCSKSFALQRVTSWYLYKVKSPTGETVDFEYSTGTNRFYHQELSATKNVPYNEYECSGRDVVECTSIMEMVEYQKLSKISSPGIGEVNFDFAGGDLLKSVSINNAGGSPLKQYNLTYKSVTPLNFHNDKTNHAPRNFLYSLIESEPVSGDRISSHNFYYVTPEQIAPRLSYAQDHYGYFNGKSNLTLLPSVSHTLFANDGAASADRSPDFNYAKIGALAKIVYPTGGSTTFEYEAHTNDQTGVTGGIRIAKMIDDPEVGNPVIKKYEYDYFGTSNSSGFQKFQPYYVAENTVTYTGGSCIIAELRGKSIYNLTNTSGGHVGYRNVTILHGETGEFGKEQIEFKVFGNSHAVNKKGNEIVSAPTSNLGWGYGLEEKRVIFEWNDSQYVKRKTILNEYQEDSRGSELVKNMVIRDRSTTFKTTFSYPCDASNTDKIYYTTGCTTNHTHKWVVSEQGPACVQTGNNMSNQVYYDQHPCYGKSPNTTQTNQLYFHNIDVSEYKRNAFWFYKTRTTETDHIDGGTDISKVYEYYYDNEQHFQLSRTVISGSDGGSLAEHVYYPEDYNNNIVQHLIDGYFTVPVKKETTREGNLVSGTVIKYTDQGQPFEQYVYRNDNLTAPSHDGSIYIPTNYELTSEWQYDSDAYFYKPIQFTSNPDDTPVSFIWGYGGRYPVAKILNATYDQLVNAVESKNIPLSELHPSEDLDGDVVDAIKDQIPMAIIETYTIDPLVGITSMTDHNKRKFLYDYDELGRLIKISTIKDGVTEILKEYEYSYTNK